mmetsp:Transcript_33974/g.60067  ORF Transcript_33974/g.60067 Transcript_33974/m.60067 type:complete len:244 (+) Transcript_33974:93-824(+)
MPATIKLLNSVYCNFPSELMSRLDKIAMTSSSVKSWPRAFITIFSSFASIAPEPSKSQALNPSCALVSISASRSGAAASAGGSAGAASAAGAGSAGAGSAGAASAGAASTGAASAGAASAAGGASSAAGAASAGGASSAGGAASAGAASTGDGATSTIGAPSATGVGAAAASSGGRGVLISSITFFSFSLSSSVNWDIKSWSSSGDISAAAAATPADSPAPMMSRPCKVHLRQGGVQANSAPD